jgi:hypothetical protein
MEHIIVSVANRVEVYSVEGKEMKQIATHHAPHYVVRPPRPLSRRRRDSFPSDEVAGGLYFDFEPFRTASVISRRVGENVVAATASRRCYVAAAPSP